MSIKIDINARHELINVDDIAHPVYRVLEVSRLIDIFEKKELSLTRPKLWDDPYENFLKYSQGIDRDNDKKRYTYDYWSNLLFGQCWTFNKENDAICRVYSPQGDRVKVKTTIKKLFDFFNKFQEDGFHSYIGVVQYDKEINIKTKISNVIRDSSGFPFDVDKLVKDYYLVKRDVFDYENGVRLLFYLPPKPENYINSIYQDPNNLDTCNLPLDAPQELFDEIVFDPRMTDSLTHTFISFFKNNLNFQKDIYKSTLYNKPYIREKVKYKF